MTSGTRCLQRTRKAWEYSSDCRRHTAGDESRQCSPPLITCDRVEEGRAITLTCKTAPRTFNYLYLLIFQLGMTQTAGRILARQLTTKAVNIVPGELVRLFARAKKALLQQDCPTPHCSL